MKNTSRYLIVTLFTSVPAFAGDLPAAGSRGQQPGGACQTLKTSEGQVGANAAKREKNAKSSCGGEAEQNMKQLQRQLQACKNLAKTTKGQTLSVNPTDLLEGMAQHYKRACEVHKFMNEQTNEICKGDKALADQAAGSASGVKGQSFNSQQADFKKLADLHGSLVQPYKGLGARAGGLTDAIDKNMPGLKKSRDGQDKDMNDFIKSRKATMQLQAKALIAQIRAQGAQRQQIAAQQGADSAAHLSTAEYRNFERNMDLCQEAIADNGTIDKVNKSYQSVAKDLSQSRAESAELKKQFDSQAASHAGAQAMDLKTASSLGASNGPTGITSDADRAKALQADKAWRLGNSNSSDRQQAIVGDNYISQAGGDKDQALRDLTAKGYQRQSPTPVYVNGVPYYRYGKPLSNPVLFPK